MQEIPSLVLAGIAIAGAAGALTAYFLRGRGKETIELLETNISAYKDSEKLKNQRIAYLEGQIIIKDETIKRLLENGNGKSH